MSPRSRGPSRVVSERSVLAIFVVLLFTTALIISYNVHIGSKSSDLMAYAGQLALGTSLSNAQPETSGYLYQSLPYRTAAADALTNIAAEATKRAPKRKLRIAFFNLHLPYHQYSCDQRLLQMIRILRKSDHEIHYISRHGFNFGREALNITRQTAKELGITYHNVLRASELGFDKYNRDLDEFLALADTRHDQRNPKFDKFFREKKFDVVFAQIWYWGIVRVDVANDYFSAIQRLKLDCPPILAVLTDDIQYLREDGLAEWEPNPRLANVSAERASWMQKMEVNAWKLSDLVITISDEDKRIVAQQLPDMSSRVHTLPYTSRVLSKDMHPTRGGHFQQREHLVFLGNGFNPTNALSMFWFLRHVWKLVRKVLPGVELNLLGAQPKEGWFRKKKTLPDGVHALNFVDVLRHSLDVARVFVAPVMMGTGVNTKNLEALSVGLPVVTTPKGVQGFGLDSNGRSTDGTQVVLVAVDAESFVQQIVRLYTNETLWGELSIAGLVHAKRNFAAEQMERHVSNLETLLQDTVAARPCEAELRRKDGFMD